MIEYFLLILVDQPCIVHGRDQESFFKYITLYHNLAFSTSLHAYLKPKSTIPNTFNLSGSVESHLWVWSLIAKMAIFEGVVKKSKNLMLGYEKSDFMGL